MSDTRKVIYEVLDVEIKDDFSPVSDVFSPPSDWEERMNRALWSPPLGAAVRVKCPFCDDLFWAHQALWGIRGNGDELVMNCPCCSVDVVITRNLMEIREDEDDLRSPDEIRECPECNEQCLYVYHEDETVACVNCGYSVFHGWKNGGE